MTQEIQELIAMYLQPNSDIKAVEMNEICTKIATEIDTKLIGIDFLGSITPSSTPTGTGKAFWTATQAGTYTNFGGVVVSANSFAVISRDALGAFSISQTALDLTEYAKKDKANGYVEIQGNKEVQSGYYRYDNGILAVNDYWKSVKFAIDPTKQYFATLILAGDTASFASYLDINNNFISSEERGIAGKEIQHINRKLVIPSNAAFVLLSNASLAISYPKLKTIQYSPISVSDAENLSEDKGNQWKQISGVKESGLGYYNNTNGNFTPSSWWWSMKFPINPLVQNHVTALIGARLTALAVYYTSQNVFISSEMLGVDSSDVQYNRRLLSVPTNAAFVGVSSASENLYPILETYIPINNFTNKKIWWCGTSIPATGYPQVVGECVNAQVWNEAQPSSMIRASKYNGSIVGMNYQNCFLSLSQTFAEKQSIMDNWVSGLNSQGVITTGGAFGWRDLLTGNPPADFNTWSNAAGILSFSYEMKLVSRYLDNSNPNFRGTPDVFVFDHGHNDIEDNKYDLDSESAIATTTGTDRSTYIGACNYLIKLILTANPRAKILIIGHYESDRKTNIYKAQENLAKLWGFPILRLWEKLGWNQMQITTNGYWSDSFTWHNSLGPIVTKTLTQIWMNDDLHPYSSNAKNHIAGNIVGWLKTLK